MVTGKLYDQFPSIELPDGVNLLSGPSLWDALRSALDQEMAPPLLVFDCYPGVNLDDLSVHLSMNFPKYLHINLEDEAALSSEAIAKKVKTYEKDDPVFGLMSDFSLLDFYDPDRLSAVAQDIADVKTGAVVFGLGASVVANRPHTLVLADMPRWEIQQRHRSGGSNWRANNFSATPQEKFKRGYFVEWRMADRHKMTISSRADFILDTTRGFSEATMLQGDHYREALAELTRRPFRVVPFFDPGVWGGEWMRDKFGLDSGKPNFAWCFDCVPEENSIRFSSGEKVLEFPALNLVLTHPRELLGDEVFRSFGAEFPIRFDMLDTVGGQNLSLQVHPLAEYIREHFGMDYTQDESYYILDAMADSEVYLGVKTGVDRKAMVSDLRSASRGEKIFPADEYINRFPVKKHDHVSIPAGTVHCSGANTMVLEISATPYIFTFKLWDWNRVDLNGSPRPLHLDHGLSNLQWERDTDWVKKNLIITPEVVSSTEGTIEEKTGLHDLEFLETRRVWFRDTADLRTHSTVTVMTLVEGDLIEIRSPESFFAPFTLRYGETVIIPAGVDKFTLARSPLSRASTFGAIRAWCRQL